MNKNLEMRKEKIMQEMKELENEILNEYLQTAKEWDEAVKVLIVRGYDKKRGICLKESFKKLSEEESEFTGVMEAYEANQLHRELLLMKDEAAIEKQNEKLEKYMLSKAYWRFIAKMIDLKYAYKDVKMAEKVLETANA